MVGMAIHHVGIDIMRSAYYGGPMTIRNMAYASCIVATLSAAALALSLTTSHASHAEDVPQPAPSLTATPTPVPSPVELPTLHTAPQPIDAHGTDVPPLPQPPVTTPTNPEPSPEPRTGDNMVGGPGYKAPGETYTLPPCMTEDSDNCYWDAATRGNGQGVSFVNLNGVTYYSR